MSNCLCQISYTPVKQIVERYLPVVSSITDYTSNKLQSQEAYKEEPADSTLVKEIPNAGVERRKLKTLQMDIDWNINPNSGTFYGSLSKGKD